MWLWSLSPCAVQLQRSVPLACPRGQCVPLDSSLPHHQQNRGAAECDGPAVSPLTQGHQIQCDTHSAATQIWTGFSLHTNLRGLVTGQMLLSPQALAWHTHRHTDTLAHMKTQTTSPLNTHMELNDQFILSAKMIHLWVSVSFPCGPIPRLCAPPLSLLLLDSLWEHDFKLRKWKLAELNEY